MTDANDFRKQAEEARQNAFAAIEARSMVVGALALLFYCLKTVRA
jgi:hypothetical protein